MYGVVTTVPAPVEMYDGMHAELTTTQVRCQTSTDTEYRCFQRCALSGRELTATRCRLLACSGGLNRPDKAEVSGSSPLRPTPSTPGQRQYHSTPVADMLA